MTVRQAIDILTKQRDKLTDRSIYKDENWVFQTASYIKDFFGEQSPEYTFIKSFSFTAEKHAGMTNEQIKYALGEKDRKARQFIDNCIETIRLKGIYKPLKSNFLKQIGNNGIWAIISISIPGLLTIGYIGGQYSTDTKNFKLEQQVKQLQDSLFLLRQSISPTFVMPGMKYDSIANDIDTKDQQ